jgi:hypothetical protein
MNQDTLTPLKKSKELVQRWMSGVLCHVRNFWSFLSFAKQTNKQPYLLNQLEEHQPHVVFQRGGAHRHWARTGLEFLDMHFHVRWVGRDKPIPLSPRSPDITPLDFFLWEGICYKHCLQDPHDLSQ